MSPRIRGMIGAVVVAVLAVGACDGPGERSPEEMGAIAASLHADPARTDEILHEHEMTRAEFEDRIWEISEEPEDARRFTQALEAELETRAGAVR